jgi:hypothetical protein
MLTFAKRPSSKEDQARLIGEPREGGHIYLTSPDLPGFTFMLEPHETNIEAIIEAITPALSAYLATATAANDQKPSKPWFSYADIRGIHEGKPMNLIAELCIIDQHDEYDTGH